MRVLVRGIVLLCCLGLLGWRDAAAGDARHRLLIDYVVQADGTYVRTLQFERRANTEAGAKAIGQFAISFSPSRSTVEVVEAQTKKANGQVLPVGPEAIKEQLAPGSENLSMFTDMRQKVLIFPQVAAGDAISGTIRQTQFAAQFKDLFSAWFTYPRTELWDEVQITITTPATMMLQADSLGFTERRSPGDGTIVHRWRLSPQPVLPDDPAVVSATDRPVPRLIVTSAESWDNIGRAYADLALTKEAVTPRIQAHADAITAQITDRRAQAAKLYEWVSRNIRYVAVYLGNGGVEPHDADWILANGYGDCKDHAVLLGALLRAKGIASEPALINLGNSYRMHIPAPFPQLNHVITYLPEFDLYVDSTAGVADFGVLPFQEYGKPVVHAGTDGPALRQVPSLPPDGGTVTTTMTGRLTNDDRIIGHTETEATGPFALTLRHVGQGLQRAGPVAGAARQLRNLGEDGNGTFAVGPIDLAEKTYKISGQFDIDGEIHAAGGTALAIPLGLQVLARPGDILLGPMSMRGLPANEPTPCHAGRQVEILSLTFPADRQIVRLPAGRTIDNPAFTYTSRWSQDGHTVIVRRSLTSRIDRSLCEGELRKETARALQEIRRDQAQRVLLADQ